MEKKKKSPRRLKFNTVQTVVIGFFGVILGGGTVYIARENYFTAFDTGRRTWSDRLHVCVFPFIGKKDQYERKNHDPTGIWTGYAFRSCKVRDPYFKRNVFGRGDRRGTFFAPVYS